MDFIKIIIYLTFILAFSVSCTENKYYISIDLKQNDYEKVKIDELIRKYKNYHEYNIETTGIFKYQFENVALYKNRWSALQNNFDQSFWLDFHSDLMITDEELKKLKNKRITVKGNLNIYDNGHLGKHVGTITVDAYLY